MQDALLERAAAGSSASTFKRNFTLAMLDVAFPLVVPDAQSKILGQLPESSLSDTDATLCKNIVAAHRAPHTLCPS